MENPDKKLCKDYKSFVCAFCLSRGKESCCLSMPEYRKRNENWKKKMHAKANEIRGLDLQIAKLKKQRTDIIQKLSQKDYERVQLYLDQFEKDGV